MVVAKFCCWCLGVLVFFDVVLVVVRSCRILQLLLKDAKRLLVRMRSTVIVCFSGQRMGCRSLILLMFMMFLVAKDTCCCDPCVHAPNFFMDFPSPLLGRRVGPAKEAG